MDRKYPEEVKCDFIKRVTRRYYVDCRNNMPDVCNNISGSLHFYAEKGLGFERKRPVKQDNDPKLC